MKGNLIGMSLLMAGTCLNAQTQYAGDGLENPSVSGVVQDWDTTSSLWLDINTGAGTYGTWVQGNDADFPSTTGNNTMTLTEDITVGNIDVARAGDNNSCNIKGTNTLNFNNSVLTTADRIYFNVPISGTISDINAADQVWFNRDAAPGTSVSIINNSKFLLGSNNLDWSGATVTVDNGGYLQVPRTNVTVGTIRGTVGEVGGNNGKDLTINNFDLSFDGVISTITEGHDTSSGTTIILGPGTHTFDLNSNGGTLENDSYFGDHALTLGGNLVLTLLAGSDPLVAGDTFQLFGPGGGPSGAITGSFASIDDSALNLAAGLSLDTSMLAGDGIIKVISAFGTLTINSVTAGSPHTVELAARVPAGFVIESDFFLNSATNLVDFVSLDPADYSVGGTVPDGAFDIITISTASAEPGIFFNISDVMLP